MIETFWMPPVTGWRFEVIIEQTARIADLAKRVAEKFQTQTSDHTKTVDFPKEFSGSIGG
jgi:hypothetical protein